MTDGGGEDDSIFDVLDEYGVEYQRERRHGRKWVQIRAGMEIGPHIVDGLRAFGYRLDGFASDTTMNFVKTDEDDGGGVRGRQEIGEVYETAEDLDEALGREISTLEAEKEAAQVPTPALTRTISILKGVRRRVLGVRDDL